MLLSNPIHFLYGQSMLGNYPEGHQQMMVGMGCFWGVEQIFWKLEGVVMTSVGYAGGTHPEPNYKLICSGATGHAEVTHIVFDPELISYEQLLKVFFETHDPTTPNQQGNDRGTQYRSVIYTYDGAQDKAAQRAKLTYDEAYRARGFGGVVTQIAPVPTYHIAEDYHQQYLAKNPGGYCNHGPTGVSCPVGLDA